MFHLCVTGSLSLSQGVVKKLVGEMEEAGFECYETDIGGEGALFMEDFIERDIKGAAGMRTVQVSSQSKVTCVTLELAMDAKDHICIIKLWAANLPTKIAQSIRPISFPLR